jgi:hypothetical protein
MIISFKCVEMCFFISVRGHGRMKNSSKDSQCVLTLLCELVSVNVAINTRFRILMDIKIVNVSQCVTF